MSTTKAVQISYLISINRLRIRYHKFHSNTKEHSKYWWQTTLEMTTPLHLSYGIKQCPKSHMYIFIESFVTRVSHKYTSGPQNKVTLADTVTSLPLIKLITSVTVTWVIVYLGSYRYMV